jgi:adenine C2-methylase RlmN of 23S rRNA A2503 and tRNA A37
VWSDGSKAPPIFKKKYSVPLYVFIRIGNPLYNLDLVADALRYAGTDGIATVGKDALDTTRYHTLRGILEGVTYEMALNLHFLAQAGVQVKELRAIGGGANSSR